MKYLIAASIILPLWAGFYLARFPKQVPPMPRVFLTEPDEIRVMQHTLEWRADMPPQRTKEPLRISL